MPSEQWKDLVAGAVRPNRLDEAIAKYKIPAWPYEPVYDRIIVFTVPEDKAARETVSAGGLIVKTQGRQAYEMSETPRGIVVAAGLGARDVMRSHGIDIGHMVWVARLSPWRHEVDVIDGRPIEFLFLRVGDIVGSEDLKQAADAGAVAVAVSERGQHQYVINGETPPIRVDAPSYVA